MAKQNGNTASKNEVVESTEVETTIVPNSHILNASSKGDVNYALNRLVESTKTGIVIGTDGKPIMIENAGEATCPKVEWLTLDQVAQVEEINDGEKSSRFVNDTGDTVMMFQINGNSGLVVNKKTTEPSPNFGVVDMGFVVDSPANRAAIRDTLQFIFADAKIASAHWTHKHIVYVTSLDDMSSGTSSSKATTTVSAMAVKAKGRPASAIRTTINVMKKLAQGAIDVATRKAE
jgi:hypothetical protein